MDKSQLLSQIKACAGQFSGVLGICAQHLDTGERIEWNPDETFLPASTIKVPILAACLEAVREGRVSLGERLRLSETDKVIGSGILKDLCPGVELSLEDLLILMIIVSDNTATNLVLDRVPPAEVTRYVHSLGLTGTVSAAKLFSNSGRSSTTTPADMVSLFVQLGSRSILTPELCDKALEILSRQQLMDIMARELPYDPFNAEEGSQVKVKLACKSGALRGVHHDVGLVTTQKGTYALALMSKDCADQRFHPDNEAVLVLAHISRWVFEYYNP